jgi:hypothetical protein
MCGDHAHHKNDSVDRKTWYLQMKCSSQKELDIKLKIISNVNNQTCNKLKTGFVDYATAHILVSDEGSTAETTLRSKVKTDNY